MMLEPVGLYDTAQFQKVSFRALESISRTSAM